MKIFFRGIFTIVFVLGCKMMSEVCICGKVGDKKCSRCKLKSYCSRQCQGIDYSNHKAWCKMMAYQTNTESCATPLNCALTMLRQLPIRLTNNPWPTPPMSCPIVPLERFIPLFTIFATANLQFQFVANVAPLLYVNRNGNNFTCVSLKTFSPTLPKFQTFTSFNDFNGGDTLPASLRSDPQNMRDAFLMLSFSIKCTQLTSCFGMVVLKMFHTHHMTYGGERIIGWAIQDGYMDSKHPEFGEMEILFVRNSNDSVKIVECLNNNEEVPRDLADRVPFTGSTTHIWLTFVTESGRVFDLDLSAPQFGPSLPFPCILPVDINVDISKCFNGMCKRDRIVTSTLKELEDMVDELISTHVTMVTGMTHSNKDLKVEGVKVMFRRVVEQVSNPISLNELPKFDNPHYFWNFLCNVQAKQRQNPLKPIQMGLRVGIPLKHNILANSCGKLSLKEKLLSSIF